MTQTSYDPVIGGQEINLGPVIGGIEAIKYALQSDNSEVRMRALEDALNYGDDGANLAITVMKEDKDWRVQYWAWKILLESNNTSIKDFQIPYRKIDDIRARYETGERDFRWADLHKANLNRVDLREADLSFADLRGANLSSVNLREADLSFADLRGTKLSGVNLRFANLRFADLRDANLRGANLSDTNLSGASLRGADLSGVDLRGSVISCDTQIDPKWRLVWEIVNGYANVNNLSGTDLSRASLSGADLSGADLSFANLSFANLRGANLREAKLDGANLKGTNLEGAKMLEVTKMPGLW
ncbi:pentapeptide repeat-containing protein [Synechococcus sp. C9]|jgi:uncharacterized protein YjbI with pentapeptide repeats|uniref:pentapeptide repeat-containing protein n=1 Tax=Synechococcus sp. C9 TaxID=102119 RepID=UPI001FF5EC60|nr:pentapeptide repeat-containing protein [Synechococcus sp. C9]